MPGHAYDERQSALQLGRNVERRMRRRHGPRRHHASTNHLLSIRRVSHGFVRSTGAPAAIAWGAHIAAILGQEPEIRLPKMAPKRKSYTTTSLETGHA